MFELYFDDLNTRARNELLQFCGITDPKELNWDTVPIVTFERAATETEAVATEVENTNESVGE